MVFKTKFVIMAVILIIWNVIVFAVYGVDKLKARRHEWRVPESVLLWLACLGGGYGALAAMFVFRHKTQHRNFCIIVPLAAVVLTAVIILSAQ